MKIRKTIKWSDHIILKYVGIKLHHAWRAEYKDWEFALDAKVVKPIQYGEKEKVVWSAWACKSFSDKPSFYRTPEQSSATEAFAKIKSILVHHEDYVELFGAKPDLRSRMQNLLNDLETPEVACSWAMEDVAAIIRHALSEEKPKLPSETVSDVPPIPNGWGIGTNWGRAVILFHPGFPDSTWSYVPRGQIDRRDLHPQVLAVYDDAVAQDDFAKDFLWGFAIGCLNHRVVILKHPDTDGNIWVPASYEEAPPAVQERYRREVQKRTFGSESYTELNEDF
jgi:hypothetical protein